MKTISLTRKRLLRTLPLAVLVTGIALDASAVPSYSRQTGDECSACHVGGFGPQLTPHGMKFKLGGYTDSDGKDGHIPLSAMLVANYTSISKDLPEKPEHFDTNDNFAMQEMSAFIAGRFTDHIGSFAQITYSGVDRVTEMDNADIRIAGEFDGTLVGVSFNNNPGITDPLNTLPAWRAPYTSADLGGGGPSAAPILDDALGGTVYGANVYAFTEGGLYGEIGLYKSFNESALDKMNLEADAEVKDLATYWRAAYIKDMHNQAFSVGLIGMNAELRAVDSSGAGDQFTDIGVDANYQYLGNRTNIVTFDLAYINEDQNLKATYAEGGASDKNATLKQLAATASYYYQNTYGVTARYFNTTGSADPLRYSPTDDLGDPIRSGKPDSTGYMLQADWTPFGKEESWKAPYANVRVGLQYISYSKIDGASKNWDGGGRDAADEDTVSLFLWTSI